jgi:hypothetical protein
MRWCARLALIAAAGGIGLVQASTPAPKTVIPFIEDDAPRALAQARAQELPVFVEYWAPW